MPPYDYIEFEYTLLMFGFGLSLAILIILTRGALLFSYKFDKRSDEEMEGEIHEYAQGIREAYRPVPLFFWVVLLAFAVWSLGYVLFRSALWS